MTAGALGWSRRCSLSVPSWCASGCRSGTARCRPSSSSPGRLRVVELPCFDWPHVQISGRKPATTDAPMREARCLRRTGFARGASVLAESPSHGGEITKRIFDFLRSRDARMACPFCGREDWHGWDERVALEHVAGGATVDRGMEAFALTCGNCGFIRPIRARARRSARPWAEPAAPREA